jgi:predicted dehydrogenase
VHGTHGSVLVENPIAPQYGYKLLVTTSEGERAETVADGTSYAYQLEAFADAVLKGQRAITSGADSIANSCAMDAIYRAAGLSPRPRSALVD